MHVQFPRLHNTTEDFDTTIDNLWLPPQFDSSTALHDEIALASSSLTTLATSVGKSGPVSALNPLQTNMLPCDVLCRNQLNAAPNLTISQNISIANKNTSLSSPRSALMKKQAIVVKVEKSIENFRQEKFELLRGHMNLLFNNLT